MTAVSSTSALFERAAPPDNEALRRALYAGRVWLAPPTPASLALVRDAQALLVDALGPEPRLAQHRMSADALFERIGAIRKELYTAPRFHGAVRAVARALGFSAEHIAFDPLRLRVVKHAGDDEKAARAVYYPHRDTWYGHPQGLITWWMPLDDLAEKETFVFYPERFAVPVPNNSEIFDYDEWVRDGWDLKIGWQSKSSGLTARYPGIVGDVDGGPAHGFSCQRAENLLFAGAHFHRTLPQRTGRTRFSLDFRILDLRDHAAGLGAPNVDSRARGSAVRDYVHPDGAG